MTCGLCKNCKHWEKEHFEYVLQQEFGIGHCTKVLEDIPDTQASLMHQDDTPCLITTPDFGCVQFQEK